MYYRHKNVPYLSLCILLSTMYVFANEIYLAVSLAGCAPSCSIRVGIGEGRARLHFDYSSMGNGHCTILGVDIHQHRVEEIRQWYLELKRYHGNAFLFPPIILVVNRVNKKCSNDKALVPVLLCCKLLFPIFFGLYWQT